MEIRLATLLGTCCHRFYQIVYFALFWASGIFCQLATLSARKCVLTPYTNDAVSVLFFADSSDHSITLYFDTYLYCWQSAQNEHLSLYFAPVCDFYCLAGLHFFTDSREFSLRPRKFPSLWYDFFGPDLRKTPFLFMFDLYNYIFII